MKSTFSFQRRVRNAENGFVEEETSGHVFQRIRKEVTNHIEMKTRLSA